MQYWSQRQAHPQPDHQEHRAATEEAVRGATGSVSSGAAEAERKDHRRPQQENPRPHEGGAAGQVDGQALFHPRSPVHLCHGVDGAEAASVVPPLLLHYYDYTSHK